METLKMTGFGLDEDLGGFWVTGLKRMAVNAMPKRQ
jgi:hypothetical protein